jgi:hypothetical protein
MLDGREAYGILPELQKRVGGDENQDCGKPAYGSGCQTIKKIKAYLVQE